MISLPLPVSTALYPTRNNHFGYENENLFVAIVTSVRLVSESKVTKQNGEQSGVNTSHGNYVLIYIIFNASILSVKMYV